MRDTSTSPVPAGHGDKAASLMTLIAGLEQTIDAEIAALQARDTDALRAATETKRSQLVSLDRLWRDCGAAVSALLDASTDAGRALTDAIERCHTRNLTAGAAIASLEQRLSLTLAMLGHGSEQTEYSASGKRAQRPSSSRAIVC